LYQGGTRIDWLSVNVASIEAPKNSNLYDGIILRAAGQILGTLATSKYSPASG
jgi:hypothetical protein